MSHPVLKISLGAMVASGTLALMSAILPARALTMKECSAKYQAAQSAGTLNGMKWNDFRKSQCGADTPPATTTVPNPTHPSPSAAAASSAAPAVTKPVPPAAAPVESKPTSTTSTAPAGAANPGNAVYPSSVSPKYSQESAGKARMHTCLDQYNSNKATNANGGLNWIQKGGGYYATCSQRLKG